MWKLPAVVCQKRRVEAIKRLPETVGPVSGSLHFGCYVALGSSCTDRAASDHVVDVCSLAEAVAAGEGVVGEAAGGGDV